MANKYEDYIKNTPHLAAAWAGMQNPQTAQDRLNLEYWNKSGRNAGSLEAFGKSHAAETNALITGDYQKEHGAGSTKVQPGENTAFARSAIPELERADVKDERIQATTASVTPTVTPTVTQPVTQPVNTQRGFLNQPVGSGRFPSGYPVAPMGYPSGVSYPAAQDAAQGWAGEMGFNINPRGGLLLRPWEAASWDLSGIDPALWDAPFAGGGFLGGGYPGGVPGGYPGGYPGTTPGPINTGGTTGTTTTDTSGNQWVMSPGGQWYPADSDYGQGLLGTGRLFYDQHYDSSGNYVGAEGEGVRSGSTGGGVPWQDSFLEPLGTKLGWNPVYPGVTNPLAEGFTTSSAPGYDYTMTAADLGLPANQINAQPSGFLANIATAPTIVSANPGSVWGDYMDEVETEAGTGVDTTGVDTGYGGGYGRT